MKNWGRIILTVGCAWLFTLPLHAQSFLENALTFSQTPPSGSARITALGGASTALGGDYSTSYSNPAGLGMYNRSEFTISPAFNTYSSTASYLGNQDQDSRSVIAVPGISLVIHSPYQNTDNGFLGGSLGISMTRTNDFNSTGFYHGTNTNSSIIDYFIDYANGNSTNIFEQGGDYYNDPIGLSYHTYLIDPTAPGGPQYTTIVNSPLVPAQSEQIVTKGSNNQWNFSYGANYKDKLFLGASIGLSSLHYVNRKDYQEYFSNDTLNYLSLGEKVDIRGSGVNATFGVTARPVNYLQVGVAFTTPTFYSIDDNYSADLAASWNNITYNDFANGPVTLGNEEASTDPGGIISKYNITTPLKFRTGIALISKFGFLTGEVEFMNPARTKYSSDTPGITFHTDNENIQSAFKPVTNIRVGAEFRRSIFRVRAGYAYTSNALRPQFAEDLSTNNFTGGLGIRTKSFFVDLGVLYGKGSENYSPYIFTDGTGPVVNFNNASTRFTTTVGFNL